jgi:hypothetical protein
MHLTDEELDAPGQIRERLEAVNHRLGKLPF